MDYLVVDLGTGEKRHTDAAPDLSRDTCRTKELWLRFIPKGKFTMGSPVDEVGKFHYETPHPVTITEDFHIGIFQMTQKQYSLVCGCNPSWRKGKTRPVESVSYGDIRGMGSKAGAGWPECGHAVDEDSFLGRLRARTGLTFDLPTEAQWEYACRAGTSTALNTGSNLVSEKWCNSMDEAGRYKYNIRDGRDGYKREGHARVGTYLPNAWGLYDMHGNVWEWCLDWWKADLGSAEATDPMGPSSGVFRVERGGCSWDWAASCRSACRINYLERIRRNMYGDEYYSFPGSAFDYVGFRVVCLTTT